jgi:hypothetical protein
MPFARVTWAERFSLPTRLIVMTLLGWFKAGLHDYGKCGLMKRAGLRIANSTVEFPTSA